MPPMSPPALTSFEDALRIVLDRARVLDAESVAIADALNRILAEDVRSDMDMPPFDKSAMDGYACRRADLGGELRVVGTVPAGQASGRAIGPGECARIMTGAAVPEGADCVIRLEDARDGGPDAVRFIADGTPDNICARGEDVRAGDVVLRRGVRLRPQHIAVLASAGCTHPRVARQPRVGVIPTGDELVEPDVRPGPSQIRNSNGCQLCAQALAMGVAPRRYAVAADRTEALAAAVRAARDANDVVLVSGGVSMGAFDLVPDALERNGVRLLFRKIAVKPGMPTVFGVQGNAYFFGLAGNPVSTFVVFEILVKPFLFALMGHDFRPFTGRAALAERIVRKDVARDGWIPVRRDAGGAVRAVAYHGPAHVTSVTAADGLIRVPKGVAEVAEGTLVDVRPI